MCRLANVNLPLQCLGAVALKKDPELLPVYKQAYPAGKCPSTLGKRRYFSEIHFRVEFSKRYLRHFVKHNNLGAPCQGAGPDKAPVVNFEGAEMLTRVP